MHVDKMLTLDKQHSKSTLFLKNAKEIILCHHHSHIATTAKCSQINIFYTEK